MLLGLQLGLLPGMDLLAYALVDPDEGVRTRAQELWEEEITR
jgi:hypothetical protein